MGNDNTIPPISAERVEDLVIKNEAVKRASVEPLPGALADAYGTDTIKVGEFSVRKIVASDYVVLRQLDSPIIKQLLEFQKSEELRDEVPYTDEEEWEMVWQFTHSPREVRDALAKGREDFRARCAGEVGDSITGEVCKLIIGAIFIQLAKNGATAVKYGEAMEKNGAGSFFRELQQARKTASDGG